MLREHTSTIILSWDEVLEKIRVLRHKVESSDLNLNSGINPLNDEATIIAAILAISLETKINKDSPITLDIFSDKAPTLSLYHQNVEGLKNKTIYADEIYNDWGVRQKISFPWHNL